MSGRAQTTLPALAVALLVLTTTLALGMALGEQALTGADREPQERRVAVALSERLVAPDAPLTVRANVLNETAVDGLTAEAFRQQFPVVGDRAVRVRLDNETLVDTGVVGGTTIRRLVLVSERETRSYEPQFVATNATTLPRRAGRVRLQVDTPADTRLETVRANGRVVRHNDSGVVGNHTLDLSRYETARLSFAANRSLSQGDVVVTYGPERTTKATLEVTVGD